MDFNLEDHFSWLFAKYKQAAVFGSLAYTDALASVKLELIQHDNTTRSVVRGHLTWKEYSANRQGNYPTSSLTTYLNGAKDGSGELTKHDVLVMLLDADKDDRKDPIFKMNLKFLMKCLKEADKNDDSKISLNEFKEYIAKAAGSSK